MMILEDFYLGRSFGRSGQGDRPGLKFTWTWTWEHEREKLMGECPDGPGHNFLGQIYLSGPWTSGTLSWHSNYNLIGYQTEGQVTCVTWFKYTVSVEYHSM